MGYENIFSPNTLRNSTTVTTLLYTTSTEYNMRRKKEISATLSYLQCCYLHSFEGPKKSQVFPHKKILHLSQSNQNGKESLVILAVTTHSVN